MNPMNDPLSQILHQNIEDVRSTFPEKSQQMTQDLIEHSTTECLWHKKNFPGHVGNFGLMNECLDCLEEIKKGRCTVDVKNFAFDTYWVVKKFWDKVDIKGQDECWPWLGATKKKDTETAAYMPSPFHSGRIQSAARVAFWTSRGYVGRLRVFHQPGCDILCCNPLHLRIRELESIPTPSEISVVNLSYGNIFNNARAEHFKN